MRIMFDATFGPTLVVILRSFFALHSTPRPRFDHLYDEFPEGVKDNEWIPALSTGVSMIITADRGRNGSPRLPEICSRHGITHVLLAPSMQKAKRFQVARSIIVLWPELVNAVDAEPGSRFQIEATGENYQRFRWVQKIV